MTRQVTCCQDRSRDAGLHEELGDVTRVSPMAPAQHRRRPGKISGLNYLFKDLEGQRGGVGATSPKQQEPGRTCKWKTNLAAQSSGQASPSPSLKSWAPRGWAREKSPPPALILLPLKTREPPQQISPNVSWGPGWLPLLSVAPALILAGIFLACGRG